MYKKSALLVFFIFLIGFSFASVDVTYGAVYYVDNVYGNNANSGKYTTAAWKTIAKVNTMNFLPGDQILFKRGGVWYETLTVKSSGTSTSPITYGAYGSGNAPLIDASNSRNNCIYLYGKSNVIIENFKLQNAIGSGAVRVSYGSNVKVRNNQIFIKGHGGVFIESSNNCLVANNSMTSPSGIYDKQTDGIYSQRNTYNIYDGNNIHLTNNVASHHIDGIQSFTDNNLTVRNNYIYQQNMKTNAQGIYATTASGIHTYFNNVVYCPNTISAVIGFRNLSGGTGSLRMYHNTLIGKGGTVLIVTEDRNFVAKNNMFIATLTGTAIVKLVTMNNPANLNYNLYYNGGGTKAGTFNGVTKTFSEWKALGFESKGVMVDPKLETNFTLKPGSGAINKALNLGTSFQYDKGGRLRPQMNGVDIGAYESMYAGKVEEDNSTTQMPEQFELSQNYPNPFNPSTRIRFSLPEASEVSLKVYDILGKEVATVVNETRAAGTHELQFDGSQLASGVYVYQLKAANFVETRKMTLLK